MKKGIWVALLSVAVVGVSLLSVFFMESWIPSGENTITTVSRSAVPANHFLYIADPDGFVLPPWDTYDANDCISFESYFKAQNGIKDTEDQEYKTAQKQLNSTVNHLIDMNEMSRIEYVVIEDGGWSAPVYPDFVSQMQVDPQKDTIYLKKASYQTYVGETRYLDFAIDSKMGMCFFQTYDENNENLSQNDLMKAKEKFQNYTEEMQAFVHETDSLDDFFFYYEKISGGNPLAHFWGNFLQINRESYTASVPFDDLFVAWAYNDGYEMISHKGLLYQVTDNGYMRIILIYNPTLDQIDGFCFQYV